MRIRGLKQLSINEKDANLSINKNLCFKNKVHASSLDNLSLLDTNILKLYNSGYDLEDISLRLLMDPIEVIRILNDLKNKNKKLINAYNNDLKKIMQRINNLKYSGTSSIIS